MVRKSNRGQNEKFNKDSAKADSKNWLWSMQRCIKSKCGFKRVLNLFILKHRSLFYIPLFRERISLQVWHDLLVSPVNTEVKALSRPLDIQAFLHEHVLLASDNVTYFCLIIFFGSSDGKVSVCNAGDHTEAKSNIWKINKVKENWLVELFGTASFAKPELFARISYTMWSFH